jgi:hypothetical protein
MQTPRIVAAGVIVLGLIVALFGLAEAQPTGTIQGSVELACSGGDLAGTLVFIPGQSFVVITDSSGGFVLSAVPAGTYTVRIETPAPGPQENVSPVTVKNNKITNLQTITVGSANDVNNCGTCGHACSANNATPACNAGTCAIAACNAGFDNCNADATDGCETNIATDPSNCGTCGLACSTNHAKPTCKAGTCLIAACAPGFADCNGSASDGCETNTASDPSNCGGCGVACPGATPFCKDSVCTSVP